MLNDLREWISDNLRYILFGLAIILLCVIGFCVVRLISGPSNRTTTEQNEANTVSTEVPDRTVNADQQSETPAVGTGSLVKDDAAILSLVRKFYTAAAAKDAATLSTIVTPWNEDVERATIHGDVESYNNLSTYSKKGLEDGTYVVFAYFDGKVVNIDTLVPSLSTLYLKPGDTGELMVYSGKDSDSLVSDYIKSISSDADVQALVKDVRQQYDAAIASNDTLRQYLENGQTTNTAKEPETEASQDSGSNSGSSQESDELMALDAVYIREDPNGEATILGTVPQGFTVSVIDTVNNGWTHVSFNDTYNGVVIEGYVSSQYLGEVVENSYGY